MFWTDDRLRRLSLSVLVSLLISCIIAALGDRSSQSLLYRGDFPAFYTAGSLAREGRLSEVYNEAVQSELQQTYWPSLGESYYAFSYPPYVAQLLAPLSALEPHRAKLLFSALMFAALLAALALTERVVPAIRSNRLAVVAGVLAFSPLFVGLFGGQNTPLSMLCLATAAWGISRSKPGTHILAGIALGIWLFKPHFALIVIAGCALFAPRQLLVAALGTALGYYALSAASLGPAWPTWWGESALRFAGEDSTANRFQMISLWSLAEALPEIFGEGGVLTRFGQAVILAFAGWIVWRCARLCHRARSADPQQQLEALFVLAPAAVLLSPHALFYELAWLVPSYAYFAPEKRDVRVWLTIALLVVSAILALGREWFTIQPLLAVPLGIFFFAEQKARRKNFN